MKTAISIPDHLFEAAEQTAKKLGISRSQLYARAVAVFLERRQAQEITKALDELYSREPSHLDSELARIQSASLDKENWE